LNKYVISLLCFYSFVKRGMQKYEKNKQYFLTACFHNCYLVIK